MEFLKFHFINIFIISLLLNISLFEDCPRDKPIFKSNECQAIFCSKEE